jgi:hypothetical protein
LKYYLRLDGIRFSGVKISKLELIREIITSLGLAWKRVMNSNLNDTKSCKSSLMRFRMEMKQVGGISHL